MATYYDYFIAGAGLGGLLSSALLSKKTQRIFLSERLPFYGGRFTAFKYNGYEIPTGAVHMIPHSYRGPFGKILRDELALPLKIIDVENYTAWYWPNRKVIRHKSFWGIFKAFPRINQRIFVLRKLLIGLKGYESRQETFDEFLRNMTDDPQIFKFFNAITGFALSLNISDLSTATMYRVLKRLYQRGRPGVPLGGCKSIINELVNFSKKNNAVLQKNLELRKLEVDGITIKQAVLRNLLTNEEIEINANHFILNLGYPQINRIFRQSKLPHRLPSTPIARGGGFIYRSKNTILGSSAIAQFPEHDYVKGAVEPTTISPNLAPKDENLLISHQVFHSTNIVKDIRKARNELLETFPQLDDDDELCIHTFDKEWPVNFASQGKDLPNFSDDILNLYFVGDGYKGNDGWIMTEGIAHGVNEVMEKILLTNKENI